jgi:hypothetical protein
LSFWILTRFENRATGPWASPPHGAKLVELFEASGNDAVVLDPLDSVLLHTHGVPSFRHEEESLPSPHAALTLLDPFRPATDLPFLEGLSKCEVSTVNTVQSLEIFRGPLPAVQSLEGAGLPVVPVMEARRPHSIDIAIQAFGFPIEARIPLEGGIRGLASFEDAGSLRGVMDLLWRHDRPVTLSPANESWGAEAWFAVVGEKVMGGEEPLALEAARILGLTLCAARIRGRGETARVVEVVPFPSAPGTEPTTEVLEAVVDLLLG